MDCYQFDRRLAAGTLSEAAFLPGILPPVSPCGSNPVVAGVDEAGVGPLAGPVVAAAVILPDKPRIIGLRDSKIVPPEQREALAAEIQQTAVSFSVAIVEPAEIDELNIFRATMKAMRLAIGGLAPAPDLIVVDGRSKPGSGRRECAVVKADTRSAAVMAASLLAKVTRDRIMVEAHSEFPQYGFDRHKGYGCREHLDAIRVHGVCPIHRRSYRPVRERLELQFLTTPPSEG